MRVTAWRCKDTEPHYLPICLMLDWDAAAPHQAWKHFKLKMFIGQRWQSRETEKKIWNKRTTWLSRRGNSFRRRTEDCRERVDERQPRRRTSQASHTMADSRLQGRWAQKQENTMAAALERVYSRCRLKNTIRSFVISIKKKNPYIIAC